MSQNTQLGVALLCGASAFGLSVGVAGASSAIGLALGFALGGAVLIYLGSRPPTEEAPKTSKKGKKEKETKKEKDVKTPKKPVASPTPKASKIEDSPDASESPEKKKKKKGKKGGGPPVVSPVKSPAPQATKAQKATPKVEEKDAQDVSKNQQRKAKLKQKKEAEDKQKAEEAAKKAADLKREAAHQKKLQAKARKAAAQQTAPVQAEKKQETKPQELEPGWELPSSRKSRGPRDGKDAKKNQEVVYLEVKIPVRVHAQIIGSQGSGLQKLHKELGVDITMPKRDSGHDIIIIKGMPEAAAEAKRALEEIASKGFSSITHPGRVSKTFSLEDPRQIGAVLGLRGSNVQRIQDKTYVKIQMPDRDSGDLKMTLTGEESDIDEAISFIQEILENGYSKATHPDWVTEEFQVSPDAIPRIVGKQGVKIQELSKNFNVKIETPRQNDPNARQVLVIKGNPSKIAGVKKEIANIISDLEPSNETAVPDPQWQDEVQEVAW